jgi:hypothetical protein
MRAIVITLERRPERLARFDLSALPNEWTREVLAGMDGANAPVGWPAGPGGWGCRMSHLMALERALSTRTDQLAVFEDDALFRPGFAELVTNLLAEAPDDWEMLMLGGQHIAIPEPVKPGIVRCVITHRTHAYIARRAALHVLHNAAANTRRHLDVAYGHAQRLLRVYAPTPFLVGQAAGYSDITGQHEPERFWSYA